MRKPGGDRKIRLTLGTQLEKISNQGSLLLSEMDFVAVKTKRPHNIEIIGSSHLFCNKNLIQNSNAPDEFFALDKLCSCEASEHSEELPQQATPEENFMKKRV